MIEDFFLLLKISMLALVIIRFFQVSLWLSPVYHYQVYVQQNTHTFLLIVMFLCQRCVSAILETNNVTCTRVFTSGRYFRNEFLTSLRSHPTLRFSHSILQETTYGILVADQRRVLHEGAAEHLHIRYDRSLN